LSIYCVLVRDLHVPEAEADVLSVLFSAGEATAAEVRLALSKRRPLAHGSVVTLLRRLESRDLVRRRKAETGKAFVYRPTRSPGRTFGPALARLLHRAFGGRTPELVASLFETRRPTDGELDDLQALVERFKRHGRSS